MSNTIKYAIGDVHGCADEFEQLLKNIWDDAQTNHGVPEVWQLGDLVDRGPDLKRVFDLVQKYDVNTIVGNHEARFVAEQLAGQKCNSRARARTHEQFEALTRKDQEAILNTICSESVNFHMFQDGPVLYYLAHSLPKSIALGKERATGAITTSTRSEELTPIDRCLMLRWAQKTIDSTIQKIVLVHGHLHWTYTDIREQLEVQRPQDVFTFNIDSGCVYGGSLTALRLGSLDVLSVPSNFTYNESDVNVY